MRASVDIHIALKFACSFTIFMILSILYSFTYTCIKVQIEIQCKASTCAIHVVSVVIKG